MLGKIICLVFTLAGLVHGNTQFMPKLNRPGRWVGPSKGYIWPKPQKQVINTHTQLEIDPSNFFFKLEKENHADVCEVLKQGAERIKNRMFDDGVQSSFDDVTGKHPQLESVLVKLIANDHGDDDRCLKNYPSTTMNETYTIDIDTTDKDVGQGIITASSPWGVLRAMESFSHSVYQESGKYFVNGTSIVDYPKLSFRGLLIDTARHFLPKSKILEVLDLMEMNKLNALHWHLTDTPSFPYESITFPELSAKGAYSQEHVYKKSDVAEIIEAARLRGIRVIPEFDTPGHSDSWGLSHPEILTKCDKSKEGANPLPIYGPMNPTINITYDFLSRFFEEVSQVFPDQWVHLGGDEVSTRCWMSSDQVKDFMKANSITEPYQLQALFEDKLAKIVKSFGVTPMVWQDVFDVDNSIEKDTVIQIWRNNPRWQKELIKVTASGHRAIVSTGYYLDIISYGSDWVNYYKEEATDFGGTAEQQSLVIGGEACLWGEYVNEDNLIPEGFPRATAVAEKLWSSKETTDINDAASRLEEHTCRMISRGHDIEPPNGVSFCTNP